MSTYSIVDELVRTTNVLSKDMSRQTVSVSLVEQARDVTRSNVAALYIVPSEEENPQNFPLLHKRGQFDVPQMLDRENETVDFLLDSSETLVVNDPGNVFFSDIFLLRTCRPRNLYYT